MTRLRLAAFALCAFAAVTVADDKPAMKMDAAKLVGSYKIVSGQKAGEDMSEDAKKAPITFAKDKITMKSQDQTFVFEYKLDTEVTPATIAMTITEPDALKGSKSKGIIKMMDGKLVIAYDPQGKETPKDFKSTKEDGYFTFTMEKAGEMKGKGKGKGKKKKDKDN